MTDRVASTLPAGGVPLADRAGPLVAGRRKEVVQRTHGAIAVAAELCIRVPRVVQDLKLEADGGAGCRFRTGAGDRVEIRLAEVFDTAVRAFGDLEIEHELKLAKAISGYDVAARSRTRRGGSISITS